MSVSLPMGFPGGSVVKNSPSNAGDIREAGSIPCLGSLFVPLEEEIATHSVFLLGKSHEQRTLAGCSP